MKTLQITLPDALVAELDRRGSLHPDRLEALLQKAIQIEAVTAYEDLRATLDTDPLPPMSPDEINAVIAEVRAEMKAERRLAAHS